MRRESDRFVVSNEFVSLQKEIDESTKFEVDPSIDEHLSTISNKILSENETIKEREEVFQ
jgi:hypothetical protein